MIDDLPTRLSIWIAIGGYGISTIYRLADRLPPARVLLTVGLVAYLVHILFAFHLHYQWSHGVALQQTVAQTKEVTGIDTQAGLYVNYLFTLIWAGEVGWWWIVGDRRYQARRRRWDIAVHGIFLFMIVNGAIVFATGPARWLAIAVLIAVCAAIWVSYRGRPTGRSWGQRRSP